MFLVGSGRDTKGNCLKDQGSCGRAYSVSAGYIMSVTRKSKADRGQTYKRRMRKSVPLSTGQKWERPAITRCVWNSSQLGYGRCESGLLWSAGENKKSGYSKIPSFGSWKRKYGCIPSKIRCAKKTQKKITCLLLL